MVTSGFVSSLNFGGFEYVTPEPILPLALLPPPFLEFKTGPIPAAHPPFTRSAASSTTTRPGLLRSISTTSPARGAPSP